MRKVCVPESQELHGGHQFLGMLLLDKLSELVKVVHQSLHHNDIEYHGNTTRDIKDRENVEKNATKKGFRRSSKKGLWAETQSTSLHTRGRSWWRPLSLVYALNLPTTLSNLATIITMKYVDDSANLKFF